MLVPFILIVLGVGIVTGALITWRQWTAGAVVPESKIIPVSLPKSAKMACIENRPALQIRLTKEKFEKETFNKIFYQFERSFRFEGGLAKIDYYGLKHNESGTIYHCEEKIQKGFNLPAVIKVEKVTFENSKVTVTFCKNESGAKVVTGLALLGGAVLLVTSLILIF